MNFKLLEAAKDFYFKDLATLKQLLQCPRADVNTQEQPLCTENIEFEKGCGRTPLYWSVENNNLPMVRFLLEQPNINGREYGKMERLTGQLTPLMNACYDGRVDIVKLMLTYPTFTRQINEKSKDQKASTPLIYASLAGHQEVVLVLLREATINVNAQKSDGWTALHAAASNGHVEIVSILLRCNKTDINIKSASNKNAIDAAKESREYYVSQQNTETVKEINDAIKLIESRAAGQTPPGDPTC